MVRSELVKALMQEQPELKREDIEGLIDVFFNEIATALAAGSRVELRGFGSFTTRQRDARQGRNPRTGAVVTVVEKRQTFFRPGKGMCERLNLAED